MWLSIKFLNMFPMEKTPLEEEEDEMDNGKDEDEGEVEMDEALNENRKVQKITIRVVYEHNHKESTTSSSSCCSSWSCCCQADECGVDLSMAKKYNQRHKVCERHSKAPVVLVSSIRQRFCQQCSKFHELAQFDDTKRSCRERLAGHNKRRRKVHAVAELHSRGEQEPATRGHFQ